MDLWRWVSVPSDLPIYTGSSTSVNALGDRQQLAVTVRAKKFLIIQLLNGDFKGKLRLTPTLKQNVNCIQC